MKVMKMTKHFFECFKSNKITEEEVYMLGELLRENGVVINDDAVLVFSKDVRDFYVEYVFFIQGVVKVIVKLYRDLIVTVSFEDAIGYSKFFEKRFVVNGESEKEQEQKI